MKGKSVHRATYCAHNSPLPLLPSGPGGVGGITSRRTRHRNYFITQHSPSLTPRKPHPYKTCPHHPPQLTWLSCAQACCPPSFFSLPSPTLRTSTSASPANFLRGSGHWNPEAEAATLP